MCCPPQVRSWSSDDRDAFVEADEEVCEILLAASGARPYGT
jgi:hypothetical protein